MSPMEEPTSQRLNAVRQLLDTWEADGILVGSAPNRRWLSGFSGSAGWLLVTRDKALLATDFRYWDQAQAQAPNFTLHKLLRTSTAFDDFLAAEAQPLMVIEATHLTLSDFRRLRRQAHVTWKGVTSGIDSLRQIKSAAEIARIRAAAAITDEAMARVNDWARPGVTERELAWQLERNMREQGADGMAFPVKVASGPNGAFPHHSPGDRVLQIGDAVIVDMGAALNGYCSDLTRTFHIGDEPQPRFWEVYNLVQQAQTNALQTMKGGMSGQSIDALARDVIDGAGHGDDFGHSLGHGIGLEVHEGPRLARTAAEGVRPGSVVTVEPGIYLSGWGGVRIEDLVLVTADGVDIISACPKQPIIPV